MRAIVVEEFGGPEQLADRTLPDLVPQAGQVAISVQYAGINFADVMDRRGTYGHGAKTPFVPGLDVYGTVREVGPGVDGVAVGHKVIAFMTGGGYADVALADHRLVVNVESLLDRARPACLAAVPTIFATASIVLHRLVRPRPADTIVVHSAAGGTGGALAAVARDTGVRLIGTVGSEAKMEAARRFGYDHVVLRSDLTEAVCEITRGQGADAVLDTVGGEVQDQSFEVLAPTGRLVVMGNAAGFDALQLSPQRLLATNRGVLGFSLTRLAANRPSMVRDAIRASAAALAAGGFEIPDLKVVPRSGVVDANQQLESGRSIGKYVMELAR